MYNLTQMARELLQQAELMEKLQGLCANFRRIDETMEQTLERAFKFAQTIRHQGCCGYGCKSCNYTGMSVSDAGARLHGESP